MWKSSLLRVLGVSAVASLALLSPRTSGAATATDLSIRATVGSLRVGGIGTCSVTVSNRGPAATDAPIHVLDTLPAGLTLSGVVSSLWTCSANGQSVDCTFGGSLNVGQSTTFRLRIAVCDAAFPSVTTTLTVVYPADLNGANDSITKTKAVRAGSCTAPPPTVTPIGGTPGRTSTPTPTSTPFPSATDLQLTKTTSSTFTVGGTGLYFLAVANLGPAATAGSITIVDSLPTGLTFVSGSGSGWSCSASGQTVSCTTATSVAAGSSTGVTLSVAVGSAAYPTVTNSASVSYAGDTNGSNNTAQRPTTIRQ